MGDLYKYLFGDDIDADSFWGEFSDVVGPTTNFDTSIQYSADPFNYVSGDRDEQLDTVSFLYGPDAYEQSESYEPFVVTGPSSGYESSETAYPSYYEEEKEPTLAGKTRDLFGIGARGMNVLKEMGSQRLKNKAGGDRFGNTRIKRGGLPTGSSGGAGQVASLRAGKAGQDAARLAAGSGSSYLSKAMESFYKGNRVTNNSIASLFQEYLSATGSSGGKAGVTTALNPALRQIAIKRTA